MPSLGVLSLDLEARTAAFQANIQKATATLNSNVGIMKRSMAGLQGTASLVQGAIAAWAGSSVISSIRQTIDAYSDAEASVVQITSALQSTGRASESAIASIRDAASAISAVTTFDDDDLVAADATLSSFAKHLSGPQLAEGEKAIAGLAAVMKVDLNTAAMQVGKTVSGASDTIGRSGIKIAGAKTEAERLNQVLEKTASFYTQAQGAAESTTGRMAQLDVTWGNLQETIGETILKSIDSASAFNVVKDALKNLDGSLQQNQVSIQECVRFMLIMGESAVHMINLVGNGVSTVISGFTSGVLTIIKTGMSFAENLVNGALGQVGRLWSAINSISGTNIKLAVSSYQMPGLSGMEKLSNSWNNKTNSAAKGFNKDLSWIFGKDTIFKPQKSNLPNFRSNNLTLAGDAPGGSSKKTKTGLTDAQKELQKQKQLADQLKESLKSIWDKEADSIAQADKLLKLHLITQGQYNQAVLNAQRTAHDSFKIEGVQDAVNNFMKPHKDFLDNFHTGLDDALNDSQFQAVQQVIQDTLTPLEKYNQQVAYLTDLNNNAGLSTDVFTRAMKAAKADLDEGVKASSKYGQAVSNVVSQFGDNIFQTVTASLQGSKTAFRDFVASAISDLAKLILKLTVTIPIANALSSALNNAMKGSAANGGGGGFLSTIAGFASHLIGGAIGGGASSAASASLSDLWSIAAFADGGDPPMNQVSLVGEQGPELFVPKTAGTIMPNKSLAGLGSSMTQQINVNQTIQVTTGIQDTIRAEIAAMRPQFKRDAVDAVSEALKKGGKLSRQVGMRS